MVESRAVDQAHWLIRDHGDEAEAVINEKLKRPGLSPADRYRHELTRRALRRLRSQAPSAGREVTVWQPRMFSAERLLRLFGVKAVDRRRRPR